MNFKRLNKTKLVALAVERGILEEENALAMTKAMLIDVLDSIKPEEVEDAPFQEEAETAVEETSKAEVVDIEEIQEEAPKEVERVIVPASKPITFTPRFRPSFSRSGYRKAQKPIYYISLRSIEGLEGKPVTFSEAAESKYQKDLVSIFYYLTHSPDRKIIIRDLSRSRFYEIELLEDNSFLLSAI